MGRVDRLNIGIFGRINAGKSTLMNLLTQQETSIVDSAPGTTADTRSAVMEIHSLGPVRLMDTAGLDEGEVLGEKKRRKALKVLDEADMALLVVDPALSLASGDFSVERRVSAVCRARGAPLLLVLNTRADRESPSGSTPAELIALIRRAIGYPGRLPAISADLSSPSSLWALIDFLATHRPSEPPEVDLLPFVRARGAVLLHIPLDEESPRGRLLRPQEMAMEYLLRMCVPIGLHRVSLRLARSRSDVVASTERERFRSFMEALDDSSDGLQLVLTDSQAVDLMDRWVPDDVPLTTFSIMMINHTAAGVLEPFMEGTTVLDGLESGDRVLIAEACNHDRMVEDIGTVQIPRGLERRRPGVLVEHSFGREFPDREELLEYRLVIHCGGCMISKQKMKARLDQLLATGVPVTNYGLVLSWIEGPETLRRVLRPWRAG